MTTRADAQPALPDLRGWAAAQLGVTPDIAPGEVRAVFLRRLAQTNFEPPPLLHRAFGLLNQRSPTPAEDRTGYEAGLYVEEVRLREEVETFIQRFFDVAPGDRRRRWKELLDQCAWSPPLAARLQDLELGLDVEAAEVANTPGVAGQLVTKLQKIILARPQARATQRQACRGLIEQFPEWQKAARYVRQAYPRLAALEPGLLEPVQRPAANRQQTPKANNDVIPVWIFGPIVVAVIGIIRVMSSVHDTTPSNPRYTPPPAIPYRSVPVPVPPQSVPSRPGQDPTWPFQEPSIPMPGVPGRDFTQPPRHPALPVPGVPRQDPYAPYRRPRIPQPPIPQPGMGWPQQPGVPPAGRNPGQPNRPADPYGPR